MIFDLIVLAFFLYVVWSGVTAYRAATGSVWQKVLAAGRDSLTIVWLRFVGFVGAGIDLLVQGADLINAPQVSAAISSYGNPKIVAGVLIGVAVIGEWARRRKGSKDPIV